MILTRRPAVPASLRAMSGSPAGPKAVDGKGEAYAVGSSSNIRWHEGAVSREAREAALGQKGAVLWFTGLSGSGKSTVAYTLEHALHARGKHACVLARARAKCPPPLANPCTGRR